MESNYNIRKDAYIGAILDFLRAASQRSTLLTRTGTVESRDLMDREFHRMQWHPQHATAATWAGIRSAAKPRAASATGCRMVKGDRKIGDVSRPPLDLQQANWLKMRKDDFHFSLGHGNNHLSQSSSKFPQGDDLALLRLWF